MALIGYFLRYAGKIRLQANLVETYDVSFIKFMPCVSRRQTAHVLTRLRKPVLGKQCSAWFSDNRSKFQNTPTLGLQCQKHNASEIFNRVYSFVDIWSSPQKEITKQTD